MGGSNRRGQKDCLLARGRSRQWAKVHPTQKKNDPPIVRLQGISTSAHLPFISLINASNPLATSTASRAASERGLKIGCQMRRRGVLSGLNPKPIQHLEAWGRAGKVEQGTNSGERPKKNILGFGLEIDFFSLSLFASVDF